MVNHELAAYASQVPLINTSFSAINASQNLGILLHKILTYICMVHFFININNNGKMVRAMIAMYLTGSEDFNATSPIQFLFSGGQTKASYNIKIFDDSILEDIEMFIVSIDPLSLPYGVVFGDVPTAEVVIIDDDSKCIIKACKC